MNRSLKNKRVQTKIEFDATISQLDNESPLIQIYVKKFPGIKNLDLFEIKDYQQETPKQSSNTLIDEDSNIKDKYKEC